MKRGTLNKTLLVWGILLFTMFACQKPVTVPPVSNESTKTYHPGKIVWHDLATGHLEESKAFYEGLFGWEIKEMENSNGNGYHVVYNQGKAIAGMFRVKDLGKKKDALWLPSMSVEDVDEAVSYMKEKGGKVFGKTYDLPGRGRTAIVQDPQGAWLALLRSKNGDPADQTARNFDWMFDQLWSKEEEASMAIYKEIAGYEVKEQTLGKHQITLFYKEGKLRAGLLNPKQADIESFWLPFVKVPDLEKTMSKIENLGGQVIASTTENMKLALITDPGGAALAIQQRD